MSEGWFDSGPEANKWRHRGELLHGRTDGQAACSLSCCRWPSCRVSVFALRTVTHSSEGPQCCEESGSSETFTKEPPDESTEADSSPQTIVFSDQKKKLDSVHRRPSTSVALV